MKIWKPFWSWLNNDTFNYGSEAYPTIEEKAARLMYSLTNNHAFVDGNKQFTSSTKTAAAYATQSQTIAFGNMASQTQNASNWAAVPEPTSGLLLLLGMAGLALKRKRA